MTQGEGEGKGGRLNLEEGLGPPGRDGVSA